MLLTGLQRHNDGSGNVQDTRHVHILSCICFIQCLETWKRTLTCEISLKNSLESNLLLNCIRLDTFDFA